MHGDGSYANTLEPAAAAGLLRMEGTPLASLTFQAMLVSGPVNFG